MDGILVYFLVGETGLPERKKISLRRFMTY